MAIRSNDHDLWKISIRDIPKDKLLSQRQLTNKSHRSEIRDKQSDFHRTKLFGSSSQLIGFTKKCSVENNAMETWAIFSHRLWIAIFSWKTDVTMTSNEMKAYEKCLWNNWNLSAKFVWCQQAMPLRKTDLANEGNGNKTTTTKKPSIVLNEWN